MKTESKALEFIYQDTQIHYLLSQGDDVMVNATEMAKIFGKRVDDFTRLESIQEFINILLGSKKEEDNHADVRDYNLENIISSNKKRGTYMCRILAIKFASWLEPKFEVWIYSKIDKILFGHYKEHWDAHIRQEDAKVRMETARKKLLLNANQEDVIAYFKAEAEFNSAKSEKAKAIRNQYSLFDNL